MLKEKLKNIDNIFTLLNEESLADLHSSISFLEKKLSDINLSTPYKQDFSKDSNSNYQKQISANQSANGHITLKATINEMRNEYFSFLSISKNDNEEITYISDRSATLNYNKNKELVKVSAWFELGYEFRDMLMNEFLEIGSEYFCPESWFMDTFILEKDYMIIGIKKPYFFESNVRRNAPSNIGVILKINKDGKLENIESFDKTNYNPEKESKVAELLDLIMPLNEDSVNELSEILDLNFKK